MPTIQIIVLSPPPNPLSFSLVCNRTVLAIWRINRRGSVPSSCISNPSQHKKEGGKKEEEEKSQWQMLVWEGNALAVWNSLRLEMAAWSQCYSFRRFGSLLAWCRSLQRRSTRCSVDLARNTRLCFYERCINKICFFWTCKTVVVYNSSMRARVYLCLRASTRARVWVWKIDTIICFTTINKNILH